METNGRTSRIARDDREVLERIMTNRDFIVLRVRAIELRELAA